MESRKICERAFCRERFAAVPQSWVAQESRNCVDWSRWAWLFLQISIHMAKTTSILSIWSSSSHILAFRIDSASCCVIRKSAGSHGSPKVACEQYTALAHFCGHFFKGNVEQSGSGNFYVSNNQALFPTGGRWLEVPCESRVVSPLQISLEPPKRDCMKMPPPAGG